jgi:hypothetical protein
MGNQCASMALPTIYRIESISSITEMWGMFSKKVSEVEYEFPSFFPEESRVNLVYTAKGKLSRVKYSPFEYDFEVVLPENQKYDEMLIGLSELDCDNKLDISGDFVAKIKEFFMNTLT